MAEFATDEWFEKVAELTKAAGELQVPKSMANVIVNLKIPGESGEVELCLKGGIIEKGRLGTAHVTMAMPAQYAYAILVKGDWSVGMKGWMKRKIKISGDLRKLMPLQMYKPSSAQEQLRNKIDEITDEHPVP